MTTDFDRLVGALRADLVQRGARFVAATELLIWHETWLRRPNFLHAAVRVYDRVDGAWISWPDARDAFHSGVFDRASTSERAVLDFAIALGQNRYKFDQMGNAHAAALVEAVRAALPQAGAGGE